MIIEFSTEELIGIAGVFLILIAFVLNLFKKIDTESKTYSIINFIGASGLSYYSFVLKAWPLAVLQIIWAIFAFYNLIKKREIV